MDRLVGQRDAGERSDWPLRVVRVDEGATAVFRVVGEVDAVTAPELGKVLDGFYATRGTVTHVVVDLSGAPFLASAGLAVLIDHYSRCAREGIDLRVAAPGGAARRAFVLTELDRAIPLYESVADAIAAAG